MVVRLKNMIKTISRRDFFKIAAVFALIPAKASPSFLKENKFGKILLSTSNPKKINGSDFNLLIKDLDTGQEKLIATSILLHSFEKNPIDPSEVVAVGQWERELYVINVENGLIKRKIQIESPHEMFVGHGAFSSDGKLFYASVASYDGSNGVGLINVYELKSGEKIKSFSSDGIEPHMIYWLDKDKKLLILNPGIGPDPAHLKNQKISNEEIFPSITLIDVETEKTLKKVDLKKEGLCLGHLSSDDKGFCFLIGGAKSKDKGFLPKAVKLEPNFDLKSFSIDEKNIPSPLLSPIVDPEGKIAAATAHTFNRVYFWDFQKGSLIKKIDFPSPTGLAITKDGSHFVIASKEKISLIDRKTLKTNHQISLGNNGPAGHCLII